MTTNIFFRTNRKDRTVDAMDIRIDHRGDINGMVCENIFLAATEDYCRKNKRSDNLLLFLYNIVSFYFSFSTKSQIRLTVSLWNETLVRLWIFPSEPSE